MNKLSRFAIVALCATSAVAAMPKRPTVEDTTLNLRGAKETLNESFNKQPIWRSGAVDTDEPAKPLTDPKFNWAAGYIWNHPIVGNNEVWPARGKKFPAWTSNTNANADPNGDMIEKMGAQLSPLKWNGTLNMSAGTMPSGLVQTIGSEDPKGYMGSSIISYPYSQKYGVFAMVAKLPKGNGIWPAFWLLPVDKSWPPELDIMEVIGKEPTTLYTTIHMKGANGNEQQSKGTVTKLDLSAEFHEYAVDWGPKTITWYFDRKQVYSQPTPPSFNQPFYILANLAVGLPNNWGGAPDATTPLPATMKVKSIRAWQRPEYVGK